ncbi:sugar kinase [Candidatus Koribacter versatilis Ellin345]|uniref:Sugar kinase n=1 Tax=Koribacter versatilis (strain Ellin345) TaxID=204669 RepID=Q1ITZ4_KORVE|nr:ROK family protein [Candidatus Koribacter versatilis]ABF39656.1 sugar kinase [Candidatus Koribacter versatilis Ellin345]
MDRCVVSIDLGGSHAAVAVVQGAKLLASREIELDHAQDLRPVLDIFANAVRELLRELQIPAKDCLGLALGFCGLADGRIGRVISTNKKYEDAPGIDFNEWSMRELGLRFAIENDARMALLGERHAGAAHGYDNVVMITLGTGIGGAALIEGKLLRGKHAQAGCLGGHLPAKVGGRLCTCGAVGCSEAEASGWALPIMAKEWKGFEHSALAQREKIDFRALFELAKAGDRVALEIREYCLQVWATAAVGLIHAYDPELIVIGGGVMRSANVILPHIQQFVNEHAWTPWGKVKIVAAELGNHAGLFGAEPLLTGNV